MKIFTRNLTLVLSVLLLAGSAFAQHTPRAHGSTSRPSGEQRQLESQSVVGTLKEIEENVLVLEDRKGNVH